MDEQGTHRATTRRGRQPVDLSIGCGRHVATPHIVPAEQSHGFEMQHDADGCKDDELDGASM
jgi:hypothetical protein